MGFRLAGRFEAFLGTEAVVFRGFAGFTGLTTLAGFAGLEARTGFVGMPGFVGGCFLPLADCRPDLDDPDFTGNGIAAYTLLILVSWSGFITRT